MLMLGLLLTLKLLRLRLLLSAMLVCTLLVKGMQRET